MSDRNKEWRDNQGANIAFYAFPTKKDNKATKIHEIIEGLHPKYILSSSCRYINGTDFGSFFKQL